MSLRLVIAIAIALACVALGAATAHLYYAPRLELAKATVKDRDDKIATQNTAIDRLKEEGEKRKQAAAEAVLQATQRAKPQRVAAQQLLSRPQPAGMSACQAACDLLEHETP